MCRFCGDHAHSGTGANPMFMRVAEVLQGRPITTEDGIFITCRFQNLCKRTWGDLSAITGEKQVRYCNECMKPVFLCRTHDELIKHAQASHCLSFADGASREFTGFVLV